MESLDYLDGQMCVRYEDTLLSEPVAVAHWWPVMAIDKSAMPAAVGTFVKTDGQGNFSVLREGFSPLMYGAHVSFKLKDGGSTKPIKTETRELKPPKTTRPTRYKNGRWEIEYKTGWR